MFPTSQRNTAWTTFLSVIKNDPVLKREIKSWKVWSGDPKDAEDFSVGMEPYLRLTPHPDKSHFLDTQSEQADILVDVELAIKGKAVTDIMDAYEAIEKAIYPSNPAVRAAIKARLAAVGIQSVEFLLGGWGVKNEGGQVLQAKGQIRLRYFAVLQPVQAI